MNTIIFASGLAYWGEFLALTGDFRWLLLLATAPDPDCGTDQFVADVSADEPTDGSYARVNISGMAISTSFSDCTLTLDCDDPSFAAFAGGEQVGWLVLYRFDTNDAGSQLMAAFRIDWTADGSTFAPTINPSGLIQFQQGQCLVTSTA